MAFIEFAGPLDLAATLESGQAFRWTREEGQSGQGTWFCGIVLGNQVWLRQAPGGVECTSEPGPDSVVAPLIRDYIRLDDDLPEIYSVLERDDRIRGGIDRFRGMRVLRQDPWECLVSFICSANNNIPRITRNVGDIASAFGSPILDGTSGVNAFPSAEQLAEAGEAALRELGLGFRAKYVAAAAERVSQSQIDLYSLREASYQEALDALVELPGVGDKIANCVLLFSLDKLEAFPVDVWIDRALREWYFSPSGETVPRVRMRAWAQERFGRYAGYANQYLFHQRRMEGRG